MDPLIKKYMELQAGLSPEQDLEALKREQEAANALKDETSRYGGLMKVAQGLSFNKDVEGPEAFLKQQMALADQPVTDVKDRQKAELSASEAVREHLLKGLGVQQKDKELGVTADLGKERNQIAAGAAALDNAHKTEAERLAADRLELDRQIADGKSSAEKDPTAAQSSAALYASRLKQANDVMEQLASAGYDRTSTMERLNNSLPNEAIGKSRQAQNQAEDNFLNAVLRKESGASISPSERESGERQYFPRPGDAKEVAEQKRQNRLLAMAGLEAEAGNALGKIKLPQPGTPVDAKVGKSGLNREQRKARLAEINRLLGE